MKDMEKWIDEIFEDTIPNEVVAIAFNLYEDEDNEWSMEMIGSGSFDVEDSDWACDEVFDTRDDMHSWTQEAEWEEILEEVTGKIKNYMESGKYAKQMKSYAGVGVGFVDGDITIVYSKDAGGFYEWKNKIEEECCADELEEMIIDYIKAGFLSNDEILEVCEEYVEENYPDECDSITEEDFPEVIETFRRKYQNTGSQENFLRLESVFDSLNRQGIVALHYAGYTQSDGFDDCNEIATQLHEKGEKVVGCCFYTEQDLERMLHGDSELLCFSFGNYFEQPTAEEVGRIIVDELKAAGFCVQWDGSDKTKIAIQHFKWDKYLQ